MRFHSNKVSVRSRRKSRRDLFQKQLHRQLTLESLEDRRMLAVVAVDTVADTIDAPGTSLASISALIGNPGLDGKISLREAVLAANSTAGADEIQFDASIDTMPIVLTGSSGEDAGQQGDLDITDDLTITGNGPANTILDGGTIDRVLDVHSGAMLTLTGVTVQGGAEVNGAGLRNRGQLMVTDSVIGTMADPNVATGDGGGIWDMGTMLVIEDTTIQYNMAVDGAGVWANSSNPATITGSMITSNMASNDGGGIYNAGTLTVDNSMIGIVDFPNTASTAHGGGIFNSGNLSVTNSAVMANEANFGAGLSNGAGGTMTVFFSKIARNSGGDGGGIETLGSLDIRGSSISTNLATRTGGGIVVPSGADADARITLTETTVSDNTAEVGGGLFADRAVQLADTTISSNKALDTGGGIYVAASATVTAVNVTVTQNHSDNDDSGGETGGGVFVEAGGVATLHNTIVAQNFRGSGTTAPDDIHGILQAASMHNLIGVDGDDLGGTDADGMVTGTGDVAGLIAGMGNKVGTVAAPIDPMLGPLADNGGPLLKDGMRPMTHRLMKASPAIDMGSSMAAMFLAHDQRGEGYPRLIDFDGVDMGNDNMPDVDIGALEFPAPDNNDSQPKATDLGTVVHTVLPNIMGPVLPPHNPMQGAVQTIEKGDIDWYKVTSWATGEFVFTIEMRDGGDLLAEVYDALGNVVDTDMTSASPDDGIAELSAPVIKGEMLWLRVAAETDGETGTYSLDIASHDMFDTPDDNDTPADATDLGMIVHYEKQELTVPWDDQDWFKFTTWADEGSVSIWVDQVDSNMNGTLDPQERLVVELWKDTDNGMGMGPDMILDTMHDTKVAMGRVDGFGVHIENYPAAKNEMFWLRVMGDPVAMSQNEYDLDIVNNDRFDRERSGLFVVDIKKDPVIANIFEINPDTGAVLRTLPVPELPDTTNLTTDENIGLAYDGTALYYVAPGGPGCAIDALNHDCIYTLDDDTGAVLNIWSAPGGSFLTGLAADGTNDLLYAVDPRTDTLYTITIDDPILGPGAVKHSAVITGADLTGGLGFRSSDRMLLADSGNQIVQIPIDSVTGLPQDNVTVILNQPSTGGEGIAALGDRLFNTQFINGLIQELDPVTGNLITKDNGTPADSTDDSPYKSPYGAPLGLAAGPVLTDTRNDLPTTRTDLGMSIHIEEEELTIPWGDDDWFKVTAWADGTVDVRVTLVDHNMNGWIDPEELLGLTLWSDANDDGVIDPAVDTVAATAKLQGFDLVIAHVPAEKLEMFWVHVTGAKKQGPNDDTILVVERDDVTGQPILPGWGSGFQPGGRLLRYDQAGNVIQVIDPGDAGMVNGLSDTLNSSARAVFDSGVISDVEIGPNGDIYVSMDVITLDPTTVGVFTDHIGQGGQIVQFDALGNLKGLIPFTYLDPADGLVKPLRDNASNGNAAADFPFSYPDSVTPNSFFFAFGFDVAPDGTIWLAMPNSNRVAHVDEMGKLIEIFEVMNTPDEVAFHPGTDLQSSADDRVVIGYREPNNGFGEPKIDLLNPNDGTLETIITASPAGFANVNGAFGINVNMDGNFWYSDHLNGVIVESMTDGTHVDFKMQPRPIDPEEDWKGNVWTTFWDSASEMSGNSDDVRGVQFFAASGETADNQTIDFDAEKLGFPVGLAVATHPLMGSNEYTLSITNHDRLEHNDFFPGLPSTSSNGPLPGGSSLSNSVGNGSPAKGNFPVNVSTQPGPMIGQTHQLDMETAVNPVNTSNVVIASSSRGTPTNEVQTITLSATAGTFELSFDGDTTSAGLSDTSTFTDVASALAGLPSIGGAANVSVSGTGGAGGTFTVTFTGVLAGEDVPLMIGSGAQIPTVVETTQGDPGRSDIDVYASFDGGHTWVRTRIDDSVDGGFDSMNLDDREDPSIASDRWGNFYLTYRVTDTVTQRDWIVVARSTDGGMTFGATADDVDVVATGDPLAFGFDNPKIAVGPQFPDAITGLQNRDDVFVSWTRRDVAGSTSDIYSAGSQGATSTSLSMLDFGLSMTSPETTGDKVNDPPFPGNSPIAADFSDIAVGPAGWVSVVWQALVPGNTNDLLMGDTDPDGLNSAQFNVDFMIHALTVDNGSNPAAQPEAGVNASPSIDVDRSGGPFNGRAYVAFTSETASDLNAYVRTSDDINNPLNTSFTSPMTVHSVASGEQFNPSVAVDQVTGEVVFTWLDARFDNNGGSHVVAMASKSADGGVTKGNEFVLARGLSDQSGSTPPLQDFGNYVGVASHGGWSFYAWPDNSPDPGKTATKGDLDVYFNAIHMPTQLPLDPSMPELSMAEWIDELTLPWFDEDWFKFDLAETPWGTPDELKIVLDLEDTDMDGLLDDEEKLVVELYHDADGVDDFNDSGDFQLIQPTTLFYLGDELGDPLIDGDQFRMKAFFDTASVPAGDRFFLRVFGGLIDSSSLPSGSSQQTDLQSLTTVMGSNEYDLHVIPAFEFSSDDLEPNDNLKHAHELGPQIKVNLEGLTIHEDAPSVTNPDYFKITAEETGKLIIDLTFVDNAKIGMGNLDLHVLKVRLDGNGMPLMVDMNLTAAQIAADPTVCGVGRDGCVAGDFVADVIAEGNSTTDNEHVVIPVVSNQMYFLHVFSETDPMTGHHFQNEYNLNIDNVPAPAPTAVFLDPAAATDNGSSTSDSTPKLFVQTDLSAFESMGIPIDPASGEAGADVEVILTGTTTGTVVMGNAMRMPGTSLWMFTVPEANELANDVYTVNAVVQITDGQGKTGNSASSSPFLLTVNGTVIAGTVWEDVNENTVQDNVPRQPNVILLLDNSASSNLLFGDLPAEFDDDPGVQDTVFEGEIAALKALNRELVSRINADDLGATTEVSLVVFSDTATRVDVDGTPGAPLADSIAANAGVDTNGQNGLVEQALMSIAIDPQTGSVPTNYAPPLMEALDLCSSLNTTGTPMDLSECVVIMVTDGLPSDSPDFQAKADELRSKGATVRAIGVGPTAELPPLQTIDVAALLFDAGNELDALITEVGSLPESFVEPGIADVNVFLDTNGNRTADPGETTQMTGADGTYLFTGLQGGTHVVCIEAPANSLLTFPAAADGCHTLTLSAGQRISDVDFGLMLDAADPTGDVAIQVELLSDDNGLPGTALASDAVVVGQSFFISITAEDRRANPSGVISLAVDLGWDPAFLEAIDSPFNPSDPSSPILTSSFTLQRGGSLDNPAGTIDSLGGGSVPNLGIGQAIGETGAEQFALLHFQAQQPISNMPLDLSVFSGQFAVADGQSVSIGLEQQSLTVLSNEALRVSDSSGATDDRSVQFTTRLSQFRTGVPDSTLVRPAFPDDQQFFDVTNNSTSPVTLFEIQVNAPDVTTSPALTASAGDDIVLNPGQVQRFQLTYAPSVPTVSDGTVQTFSAAEGLVILSDFAGSPSTPVVLLGASTFNSDIDYDGTVGVSDFGVLNAKVGVADPTADVNGDGTISIGDFGPLNAEIGRSRPLPLLADRGDSPLQASAVTLGEVLPVAQLASQYWAAAQNDSAAILQDVELRVADLGNGILGLTQANVVWIDDNAAGYGWSIGTAPTGASQVDEGARQMDLLSVVVHEFGHILGLPDLTVATSPSSIMTSTLAPNVQRLPSLGRPLTGHLELSGVETRPPLQDQFFAGLTGSLLTEADVELLPTRLGGISARGAELATKGRSSSRVFFADFTSAESRELEAEANPSRNRQHDALDDYFAELATLLGGDSGTADDEPEEDL